MTPLLQQLPFFSASAASALFSAIWQGAVLAACVMALACRLLPSLSAAARSVIWLNVFVLLILLHFVPAICGAFRFGLPLRHPPSFTSTGAGAWALSCFGLGVLPGRLFSYSPRAPFILRRLARRGYPRRDQSRTRSDPGRRTWRPLQSPASLRL